jgi:hypothetical protein
MILRIRALALAFAALLLHASAAAAQSAFYNLDSGRPTRVEDALPTPRGELEIQFLPIRAEWLGDGSQRQRLEPKVAYGVLPMTEIELRVPFVRSRAPDGSAITGVASAAIGALHAFNVETSWPALAVAAELVMPVSTLSAPTGSYALKALATKTFRFGRVELNAGGGTWSIRLPQPGPVATPNQCGDPGQPPCLPPDVACNIAPSSESGPALSCAPSAATSLETIAAGARRSTGAHWTASLGVDHTLPLISTLLAASVSMDRFDGLYPLTDWTAEVGVRTQISPQMVADLGVGRRFAGSTQSTTVLFGVSYALPVIGGW